MSVCAVLLSYKRPQNMDKIIRRILDSKYIDKIVLSNNNPEVCIEEWLNLDDYEVEIINQPIPTLYTMRWQVASEQQHDFFFCPDDDLYLTGSQIDQLIEELFANPSVPHGVVGQLKCYRNGQPFLDSDVGRVNCEIDILNRTYFFTKQQVLRTLELAKELGYEDINSTRFMDDVLLSFSGDSRPIIHHVGDLDSCETSVQKGVATWREDNFIDTRVEGYMKLQAITGRN
ncbi:hypothetical protein SNR37_001413 [Agarivorans aestuarii]|uniref:Glycosyltransferase 2-like domain-containing protein n=1 Tax=Agarivorans aestuarii TaxID=1563703 RepID=A0ABU7G9J0_9ALTE|nr:MULTISPECIES: hypothetical protein [Agarivorans]MEE1676086.1 hypothetical protein [Agarivorans aestuarii]